MIWIMIYELNYEFSVIMGEIGRQVEQVLLNVGEKVQQGQFNLTHKRKREGKLGLIRSDALLVK